MQPTENQGQAVDVLDTTLLFPEASTQGLDYQEAAIIA